MNSNKPRTSTGIRTNNVPLAFTCENGSLLAIISPLFLQVIEGNNNCVLLIKHARHIVSPAVTGICRRTGPVKFITVIALQAVITVK